MKKHSLNDAFAFVIAVAMGLAALSCSPLSETKTDDNPTILELDTEALVDIVLLDANPDAKVATSWASGYYAWVRGFDQNKNRVAIGGGTTYQVTLNWDAGKGKWTGYMNLSSLSGTITFLAVVFKGTGEVAYQGFDAELIDGANPPATMSLTANETFAVGNIGPGGGTIFYDKSTFSDSWRYLELCPAESSGFLQWASSTSYVTGTSAKTIGTGSSNTGTIVASGDASKYPAAWYCANLEHNGLDDWFLPSNDELVAARANLGSGAFARSASYWNSSERTAGDGGTNAAYYVYNPNGTNGPALKTNGDLYVKAARRF